MRWQPLSRSWFHTFALLLFLSPAVVVPSAHAQGRNKKPVPPMAEWEQAVRGRIAKDANLNALAAKYPLVLLHSRAMYANGDYKKSAFSFIYATSDEEKHGNDVQILWGNSWNKDVFQVNMVTNQHNLVADLGNVDFNKDPDITRLHIDNLSLDVRGTAAAGHVYLERVRDTYGNNFFVLIQIVEVGPAAQYVAFLWREIPGGKIVRQQRNPPVERKEKKEIPVPPMKEWEQAVRKRMDKDDKLKPLAAKYPLVILHAYDLYAVDGEGYQQSTFSFIYETWDDEKHGSDVQIWWGNPTDNRRQIQTNMLGGQKNRIADLGKVDFEKKPDITSAKLLEFGKAVEGHVFLEHVKDTRGNDFYVLFQIVALDAEGRYMAFLWRKLTGGKTVLHGEEIPEKVPEPPMKEWEELVRKRINKDDKLKALAAKHPWVLLHAHDPYCNGAGFKQSAFSFVYASSDEKTYANNPQILWGNGGDKNKFDMNSFGGQQNLVADLGKADFEKNPNIAAIHIGHPSLSDRGIAIEGHVYLQRVRDSRGNNFYVLFQVIAVDPGSRYVAFIWRTLPGGKVVRQPKNT